MCQSWFFNVSHELKWFLIPRWIQLKLGPEKPAEFFFRIWQTKHHWLVSYRFLQSETICPSPWMHWATWWTWWTWWTWLSIADSSRKVSLFETLQPLSEHFFGNESFLVLQSPNFCEEALQEILATYKGILKCCGKFLVLLRLSFGTRFISPQKIPKIHNLDPTMTIKGVSPMWYYDSQKMLGTLNCAACNKGKRDEATLPHNVIHPLG